MKKNYIVPQVEQMALEPQGIIMTSMGDPIGPMPGYRPSPYRQGEVAQ